MQFICESSRDFNLLNLNISIVEINPTISLIFHSILFEDDTTAVDILIKNGADVEFDLYGSTPLFLAVFSGMCFKYFV